MSEDHSTDPIVRLVDDIVHRLLPGALMILAGAWKDDGLLDELMSKWEQLNAADSTVASVFHHAVRELAISLPSDPDEAINGLVPEMQARLELLPPGVEVGTVGDLFRATDAEIARRARGLRPDDFRDDRE